MTYEQAMKRLEEIAQNIETGKTDIDSLSASLKEAKELVSFCKDKLTKAEGDVRLDNGTFCVDILDAFEYAWSRYTKALIIFRLARL